MESLKSKSIAILFIAILAISTGAMLLQSATAHTPSTQIQLFAFVNVAPNPAGLGQAVTVGFWLNEPPMTANGPYGDRFGPFTVNVIKPDGTNDTLGPYYSDATGGSSTHYTPTQLGEYQFQVLVGGMTLTGTTNNPTNAGTQGISNPNYVNDTILPAISSVATLTVQQDAVPAIPTTPLPTEYWQTPINAMNVNQWYAIGGPYLGLYSGYSAGKGAGNYNTTTNFNPYSLAPLSSHIMWTRPIAPGGVIGGDAGGSTTYSNYYSTSQYERKYDPIVINGVLYYTQFPGSSTSPVANVAVDLYTGKTLWVDDASNWGGGDANHNMMTSSGVVTPFACGQVLNYISPNQYGGMAYLWTTGTPSFLQGKTTGTTLNMFDAMSGKYILSIVNGTGFSYGLTVDANGNLLSYYTNTTVGTQTVYGQIQPITGPTPTKVTNTAGNSLLEVWNSTQAIMLGAGWQSGSASGWQWRPTQGGVIPFSYGIQDAWQLPGTVPTGAFANNATLPNTWTIMGVNSGTAVLYSAANNGLTNYFQTGYTVFTSYDITGTNTSVTATINSPLFISNQSFTPFTAVNLDNYGNVGDGVYTTVIKETGQVQAFDVHTGHQVWSTYLTGDNGAPMDAYNTVGGIKGNIYGNSFYLYGFGGDIWSLDMATGKVNWYTNTTKISGPAGDNTPYGVWTIWTQTGIGGGGGLVFLEEGHEYAPPLFLGSKLLALNCTDGSLVWSIDSMDVDANPELAYGIMTTLNAYDNQVYAYGRGPSTTTVSAPQVGITTATPITITGTVMDVSAGATQEAVAANYHNGLPAVSDASMSGFMEAVYMQQPVPFNTTGVQVILSVIDGNGNYRTIGTTTSDATGNYAFTWCPDISGSYTIIATFAGSNGYYPSTAQTHIYAGEAATPAPTAQTGNYATTSDLMLYIAGAVVAIIIAIAAVGILLFTKKP
jgi:hypothetical protein